MKGAAMEVLARIASELENGNDAEVRTLTQSALDQGLEPKTVLGNTLYVFDMMDR